MQRNEIGPSPWKGWEEARKLDHFRPMESNTVYMPRAATHDRGNLEHKSIILRLVGERRVDANIVDFIKYTWKPRGPFRVTKANRQSYIVGFYQTEDYDRLKGSKWDHLGDDLIIIRPWNRNMSNREDVLDTIPLKALIHNIPEAYCGVKRP